MRILLLVFAGSIAVLLWAAWAIVRAVRRHGAERREALASRFTGPPDGDNDGEDT